MSKILSVLIAGSALGLGVAGSVTSASAHYYPGCNCGPDRPSRHVHTVYTSKYVTRHRNISVYTHRTRIHRVYHVTRIQPVIHVQEVTHVHHHTIVHTREANLYRVQHLPPIVTVRHAVKHSYDCHCGH